MDPGRRPTAAARRRGLRWASSSTSRSAWPRAGWAAGPDAAGRPGSVVRDGGSRTSLHSRRCPSRACCGDRLYAERTVVITSATLALAAASKRPPARSGCWGSRRHAGRGGGGGGGAGASTSAALRLPTAGHPLSGQASAARPAGTASRRPRSTSSPRCRGVRGPHPGLFSSPRAARVRRRATARAARPADPVPGRRLDAHPRARVRPGRPDLPVRHPSSGLPSTCPARPASSWSSTGSRSRGRTIRSPRPASWPWPAAGGNGFMGVAATHAALRLAQGAGRLVRSAVTAAWSPSSIPGSRPPATAASCARPCPPSG